MCAIYHPAVTPQPTSIRALLDTYAGILLDVYGVLMDARGPLPGAADLLAHLEKAQRPYAIVTNDASRSPATYTARFARHGIAVPPERFVTSGSLLATYEPLRGKRTLVLGTEDSRLYVEQGSGEIVALGPNIEIDALAVCDDDGFEFLPGVEEALSAVMHAVEAGRQPALVLPNPDLIYPKGGGAFGFTAGAIAMLIEAALARRYPAAQLRFVHLGKPEPHLFAEAARRLGLPAAQLVMIGDQLETDIAGAHAAGAATALLAGVTSWEHAKDAAPVAPRWLLDTLWP
jgi:HAD superfamily hydrolase (TIGR01450 family)